MRKLMTGAAIAFAAAAVPAAAQETDETEDSYGAAYQRGWYVGVGLGAGSVTADGASEDGFDFDGNPVMFEGEVDYSTGFAGSLLVGYDFSRYFAVEAETTGRTNDFDGNIGDADFTVSTLMAGLVAKVPAGAVEPYVGAAAGLVSSNLEGADNVFGYQLKGGVRVPFSGGRHSVGAEASFLFSGGFEVDNGFDGLDLDYEHAAYMLTYRLSAY